MVTDVFKNRWRTLMSVDDVIGDVIELCDSLGLKDSTYFFYSSDHGFQLGQFNIPMDKRHAYDWDTKIHLVARGPGIKPGMTWQQPATQVDMAPTFLGLAGVSPQAIQQPLDTKYPARSLFADRMPVMTARRAAELRRQVSRPAADPDGRCRRGGSRVHRGPPHGPRRREGVRRGVARRRVHRVLLRQRQHKMRRQLQRPLRWLPRARL